MSPKKLTEEDFDESQTSSIEDSGGDDDLVTAGDLEDTSLSEEEGEEEPGEKGEPEPPKYEYKSQEEAEKAVKEAKAAMHRATEESARYRKALENIGKQTRQDEPPEESKRKTVMKDAMAKIRQLDAEDAEYEDKVAEIWADAHDQIAQIRVQDYSRERATVDEKIKYTEGKAKEAGINMESQRIANLFWGITDYAPAGTLDEQIEWSVNAFKEVVTEIKGEAAEEVKKDQQRKRDMRAMGRGSGRGPSPGKLEEDEEPDTLTGAIQAIRQQRTVNRL